MTAVKKLAIFLILASAVLYAVACSQGAYDISRGVDREITLFSDEVSLPIADIGPLSPKQLLGDVDLGSTLGGIFKEDGDGYLVVEKEETIFSDAVLLIYLGVTDPTQPFDYHITDYKGYPGTSTKDPAGLGLTPALQEFSLYAANPLTEGITISGKLDLAKLSSKEFDNVPIAAESKDFELFRAALEGQSIVDTCSVEDMVIHLPASFLQKDPLSGFSPIELGYRYKAYLAFGEDLPMQIPIPIKDLDLPLGQYRVKDVLLSTEVSNEIPITLVLDSVDVMVNETDEDGNVKTAVYDDVTITPGLTIASGCSGAPAITPLDISIKALEGTIPDVAGLQLNLSVKAPTGEGDKRLNMNQSIRFNNLRATVSGGITFEGL